MSAPMTTEEVMRVLTSPNAEDWTLQGFGMLRLYLSGDGQYRLHVWVPELAYRGVPRDNDVHSHPWDFESWVLCGALCNQRFEMELPCSAGEAWYVNTIKPGANAHVLAAVTARTVSLAPGEPELYGPGQAYSQGANELHRTTAVPGTVTVCSRTNRREQDVAFSLTPVGKSWVSAAPRQATADEVLLGKRLALAAMRAVT